jgi:hypothetical protein
VIARVQAALDRALPEIAGILGPAGRIALGTVYDPSDGTGDAGGLGLPPWPDGVAMIGELNDTLHAVAARHGVATAEIAEHFRGHGLLAGNFARRESRPADRELLFCNVIEPPAGCGRARLEPGPLAAVRLRRRRGRHPGPGGRHRADRP